MPEAPEVLYLANYISKHCVNHTLKSTKIVKGRYKKHGAPENYNKFASSLPLKLIDIQRKGKVLIFCFENNWYIISRLGLTGSWYVEGDKPDWVRSSQNIELCFDDHKLFYSDQLSYGTLKFTRNIENELKNVAPDILSVDLKTILERKEKTSLQEKLIEDIIIDQKAIVSGIGNYLKSEILYAAKISPLRKIKSITDNEWKIILQSSKKVIKRMGKNIGDADKYFEGMQVYRREKDLHGNKIMKHTSKDNRTTFWVPQLQK